ncbi:phosphotransferase [Streptomyces sp. NPDC047002]|uniref:phosphotransferase n=1 Tax=Streptomyces sp. NPDC047002 TaxID=3155475 RepID=UPI003453199E
MTFHDSHAQAGSVASPFERLLSAIDDDDTVAGLVLIGSRSFPGMATAHSDHDVLLVTETPDEGTDTAGPSGNDGTWRGSWSRALDISVVPLPEFSAYALPGHRDSWNRYAFVHAQVVRDRPDGLISRLVREKAGLSDQEAGNLGRGALDAYINSCHRAAKDHRARRTLQARLNAAESIPHALTALFAMDHRVRPYNTYLVWELTRNPLLGEPAFAADRLLPRLERILTDGDPATQRDLFADIERVARAHGLEDVIDAWGPLRLLRRGTSAAPAATTAATSRVLAYVNRTHDLDHVLVGRLPGGHQQGAWLLRDASGADAVLKWDTDKGAATRVRRANAMIPRARERGWPTPAWLAAGTTPSGYPYHLQQRATGAPALRVDRAFVRAALPVLDLQADLYPSTEQDWSAHDHAVVFHEASGPAQALSAFSPAGEAFSGVARAWVAPFRTARPTSRDLVHGDFTPDNVLLTDGRISALVDADALGKGTRFHDVASLVAHAALWDGEPAALADLYAYARQNAGPGEFEVSLVAVLLGLLAFTVEHHHAAAPALIPAATSLIVSAARAHPSPPRPDAT